jgi:hypothetical protein
VKSGWGSRGKSREKRSWICFATIPGRSKRRVLLNAQYRVWQLDRNLKFGVEEERIEEPGDSNARQYIYTLE